MALKRLIPVASLLLLLFPTASVWGQRVVYFPQIGDGQVADIQFQSTLIFVNAGPAATVRVEFFSTGPGAPPLSLILGNMGPASEFNIPLAAGQSISLQTPGTGAIRVGYARVTISAGANVGGTAVFTRTDIPSGVILYEAGVPTSDSLHDFTLFVDTLGNRDTGLAIVNTDTSAGGGTAGASNVVTMTLYNTSFNQIATTDVPLPQGEHQARFVTQIFSGIGSVNEMQGSLAVSSPDDVAAVTLRQNDAPGEFPDDVPVLTTFPVVEGRASGASGAFSVLADGQLAVVVDLGPEEREVTGVVFYLYDGDQKVGEYVRGVETAGVASFVLPSATRDDRLASVDRMEAELIFAGGGKSLRFALNQ